MANSSRQCANGSCLSIASASSRVSLRRHSISPMKLDCRTYPSLVNSVISSVARNSGRTQVA